MNNPLLPLLAIAALLAAAHVPSPSSAAHHSAAAPAPAVDCTSLIMNMADCLSFVSNDSTTTKPEPTCCSGLKTVLQADADCLCEAFKSSAQLGVVLNVTKALTLPAACKLSAPSASTCSLTQSPVAAPGPSGAGGAELSPYPGIGIGPSSPGNSAISGCAMPFAFLILAIVFSLVLTLDKM